MMRRLLLCGALAAAAAAAGCAIGRTADGGIAGPLRIPGDHPDAEAWQAAGRSIGGIFGPAGAVVGGTIATAIAGAWGIKARGDARAARALRDGERAGWDEALASCCAPRPHEARTNQ